ncbi:hypothetical protein K443DRAFT_679201 [Laccaria amethystina LaAM-08-1]|uniref:Uncharacterized protein n=1 Tax=Laccaria amethystina LaAM-08-1 TaxID=1095629 RepID=A0A0C9XFK2_9AGAR|nr:hypothetical protein K443DRAFT_679201 [Laccaria amethystina LaAM-08-1]
MVSSVFSRPGPRFLCRIVSASRSRPRPLAGSLTSAFAAVPHSSNQIQRNVMFDSCGENDAAHH